MNDDINKEIRILVSRIAKVPEEKISDNTNLFSDLGVDLLLGVEIFAALDKKYNLDIPEQKLRGGQTVADLINLVRDIKV